MANNIDLKCLFVIDSITLALFGITLIGIAFQIPTAFNIVLQVLFIFLALSQTYTFLKIRFYSMALIKTFMILTLLILDLLA